MQFITTQMANKNDFFEEQEKKNNEENLYEILQDTNKKAKDIRRKTHNLDKIKANRYYNIQREYILVLNEDKDEVEKLYIKYCDLYPSKYSQKEEDGVALIEEYEVEENKYRDYSNSRLKIRELSNSYLSDEEKASTLTEIANLKNKDLCLVLENSFYFEDYCEKNENESLDITFKENYSYKIIKKCWFNENFPNFIIEEDLFKLKEDDVINDIKIYDSNDSQYKTIMNEENRLYLDGCYMLTDYKSCKEILKNSNSESSLYEENIKFNYLPVYIFRTGQQDIKKVSINLIKGRNIVIDRELMEKNTNLFRFALVCGGFDIKNIGEVINDDQNFVKALEKQIKDREYNQLEDALEFLYISDISGSYGLKPELAYPMQKKDQDSSEYLLVWDGINYYCYSKASMKFLDQFENIGEEFDYCNYGNGINYNKEKINNGIFNFVIVYEIEDLFDLLKPLNGNDEKNNNAELKNLNSSYQQNINQENETLEYGSFADVMQDEENPICLKDRRVFINDNEFDEKITKYAIIDLYYKYDKSGKKIYKNIVLFENKSATIPREELEKEMEMGTIGSDKRLYKLKTIYLHDKKQKQFENIYEITVNKDELVPIKVYFNERFERIHYSSKENKKKLNELNYNRENIYEISGIYLYSPYYHPNEQNPEEQNLIINLPIVLLRNVDNPSKEIIAIFYGSAYGGELAIADLYEQNNDGSEKEEQIKDGYKQMIDPNNMIPDGIDNENLYKKFNYYILEDVFNLEYNLGEYYKDYKFIDLDEDLNKLYNKNKSFFECILNNDTKFCLFNNDSVFCVTYKSESQDFLIEPLNKEKGEKIEIKPVSAYARRINEESNSNQQNMGNQENQNSFINYNPYQQNMNFQGHPLLEYENQQGGSSQNYIPLNNTYQQGNQNEYGNNQGYQNDYENNQGYQNDYGYQQGDNSQDYYENQQGGNSQNYYENQQDINNQESTPYGDQQNQQDINNQESTPYGDQQGSQNDYGYQQGGSSQNYIPLNNSNQQGNQNDYGYQQRSQGSQEYQLFGDENNQDINNQDINNQNINNKNINNQINQNFQGYPKFDDEYPQGKQNDYGYQQEGQGSQEYQLFGDENNQEINSQEYQNTPRYPSFENIKQQGENSQEYQNEYDYQLKITNQKSIPYENENQQDINNQESTPYGGQNTYQQESQEYPIFGNQNTYQQRNRNDYGYQQGSQESKEYPIFGNQYTNQQGESSQEFFNEVTYDGKQSEEEKKEREKAVNIITQNNGKIYVNMKRHIVYEMDGEFHCYFFDGNNGVNSAFKYEMRKADEENKWAVTEFKNGNENVYIKMYDFDIYMYDSRILYRIYMNRNGEYKLTLGFLDGFVPKSFEYELGFDWENIKDFNYLGEEELEVRKKGDDNAKGEEECIKQFASVKKNGVNLFFLVDKKNGEIFYINDIFFIEDKTSPTILLTIYDKEKCYDSGYESESFVVTHIPSYNWGGQIKYEIMEKVFYEMVIKSFNVNNKENANEEYEKNEYIPTNKKIINKTEDSNSLYKDEDAIFDGNQSEAVKIAREDVIKRYVELAQEGCEEYEELQYARVCMNIYNFILIECIVRNLTEGYDFRRFNSYILVETKKGGVEFISIDDETFKSIDLKAADLDEEEEAIKFLSNAERIFYDDYSEFVNYTGGAENEKFLAVRNKYGFNNYVIKIPKETIDLNKHFKNIYALDFLNSIKKSKKSSPFKMKSLSPFDCCGTKIRQTEDLSFIVAQLGGLYFLCLKRDMFNENSDDSYFFVNGFTVDMKTGCIKLKVYLPMDKERKKYIEREIVMNKQSGAFAEALAKSLEKKVEEDKQVE